MTAIGKEKAIMEIINLMLNDGFSSKKDLIRSAPQLNGFISAKTARNGGIMP